MDNKNVEWEDNKKEFEGITYKDLYFELKLKNKELENKNDDFQRQILHLSKMEQLNLQHIDVLKEIIERMGGDE